MREARKLRVRGTVAAWGLALTSVTLAQGVEPFTVASIKRNVSGVPYGQSTDRPDGLALVNETLRDIILFAYDVHDFQLVDAPEWIARDRFDIATRADGPLSTNDKRARLRRLLADRFGLRTSTAVAQQPVYALVRIAGTSGAGLKARDCSVAAGTGLACGRGLAAADAGIVRMGGIPLTQVARILADVTRRIVNDETGLTGVFDVDLQWRPDLEMSAGLTEAARARIQERPALPAALREQLGLELRPARGSVTQLRIEAIAAPTAD